jgi:hypothetical protein
LHADVAIRTAVISARFLLLLHLLLLLLLIIIIIIIIAGVNSASPNDTDASSPNNTTHGRVRANQR